MKHQYPTVKRVEKTKLGKGKRNSAITKQVFLIKLSEYGNTIEEAKDNIISITENMRDKSKVTIKSISISKFNDHLHRVELKIKLKVNQYF